MSRVVNSTAEGLTILGIELLGGSARYEIGGQHAFAVVHVTSEEPSMEALLQAVPGAVHGLRHSANLFWSEVRALLPTAVVIKERPKIRVLAYAPFAEERARPYLGPLELAYALVSGAGPASGADLAVRAAKHRFTVERPDWSCLVLRDGAAFVSHQTTQEDFSAVLRVLVHSVHLDALLFALVQRCLMDDAGRQTTTVGLEDASALVDLERAHFEFKRTYWRTSLTDKRSAPPDMVLREFQEQLLTARDVMEVEVRVQEGARLAHSLLEAGQEEAQQRLNRLVRTVSVVIGAFGLSFAAAPVVAEPSWSAFGAAVLAGAGGAAVAQLVLWRVDRRQSSTGRASERRAGSP
ncbi:hypothetical protein [Georgenia daeguensis]|uniref:CorA-like Mg2+ transporter protein n=1 Tax=Georgenia daeguensis TaxID=908355 RepID=A0ABP8EUL4_9MICO